MAERKATKKAPTEKVVPPNRKPRTAAKKTAAKKTPTKKPSERLFKPRKATSTKESKMSKSVAVGTDVLVQVDPRSNGGSDVAAAKVTKVGEDTVNLTVFLDGEENQWVRDVPVVKSEPKREKDASGEDAGYVKDEHKRVCWLAK